MKTWQELLQQPMSKEYKDKVLAAAAREMAPHAEGAIAPSKGFWVRPRFAFLAGLAAAFAGVLMFRRQTRPRSEDVDFMDHDQDMLKDLDFYDDLETLEQWEDDDAKPAG